MNINALFETFQIRIPLIAHVRAERFCRYQSQADKARQVYLNTLAVSVASLYLNSLGWSTNLEHSDSWNLISQTMMNVADLQLPSYGKLECRTVLSEPNQSSVLIPPEVWSGRIGYLVIMLDRNLQQGQILGFVGQVNQRQLPLSQLEPLSSFPSYLSQQKKIEPIPATSLSEWFEGKLDYDWQQLDELLTSSRTMSFRNKQELPQLAAAKDSKSRVKLLTLGESEVQTIILLLNIQPQNQSEFNVSVRVSNYQYDKYLPEGLELVIVDRASLPVMIAQANQTETIEFCFSGERGERFSLEVSLEEQITIENFVI